MVTIGSVKMIGKIISHYKILEKIGEGGMGVVYLAEDTKLDRKVALKFISPQSLKSEEEKARFIQEAKAAAAINHPNITTIHEIDEVTDDIFISMEYIEGQNLKEKIESGPLQIDEALKIAIQVAEGLQEAHEKGIVHRDIKSANIMINNKEQVKIMDFGLAKLKGQSKLTKVGTTIGTAAYMSPEQSKGAIVDHRSDIWSLGVVLYEMVTGQLPFKGDYEQAVIYSILNEEPETLSIHRTDIPVELEQIINKALAKKPEERYQSAGDLLEDVRKVKEDTAPELSVTKMQTGSGVTSKRSNRSIIIAAIFIMFIVMIWLFVKWQSHSNDVKSEDHKTAAVKKDQPVPKRKMIVVLPFENLGSPEDEYFADGITEEITAKLSRIKELCVIARLSAKQYKNTNKTPQIIGRELGVDYLIEGTIRWQRSVDKSSRVRITPQLIKTSDATNIWADVYEKDLKDIFAIQAFIAEKVASSLNITLLEGQRNALAVRSTKNMKAYNYYLRGNFLFNRDSMRPTYLEALEMYKNAVELDPLFADAWVNISRIHSALYIYYFDRTDQCLEKAKKAADRAFELSPELPYAYMSMGLYYYCQKDFENALDQYKKAEKILGEKGTLLSYIGFVKRRQGHWKDAEELFFRAFKLEPRSYVVRELAETKRMLRNFQGSEHLLDLSFSLSPDNPILYSEKILNTLLWKGDTIQGINLLNKAYQKFAKIKDPYFLADELILHLCSRNYQKALKIISTISRESFDLQEVFTPKSLAAGQIYQYMKKPILAIKEYKSARRILQNRIKENPKDSRLYSSLGIALAGLGEINDAVKEGELGVELMPIKKDAYEGFYRLIDLAQIYTMVGADNKAIDQLELLLSIPSDISIALLKIDPRWDLLRKKPRFKKLLKEGKQYSYIKNDQ